MKKNDTIPGIITYIDDLNLFDELMSNEDLGIVVRAMRDFAVKGEEAKDLSPIAKVAYGIMKPKLEREIKKYKANKKNGQQGGRPRKNPDEAQEKPNENRIKTQGKPKQNPTETQAKQTETETVYETVPEYVCVNEGSENTHKPTLEEVKEFIRAEGLEAVAEDFYNYYETCHWMRGRNAIDWKAACRFWKNRGIVPISAGKKKVLPAQDFKQRDYTEEEMERNSNSVLNSLIKEKEAAN